MNGIQSILDRDALEVAGSYLHAQGKVQVNLLDRRFCQHQLENSGILYSARALVDFPAGQT